ncbi:MAG: MbcA/ParS/Xre antitoxin family protein [Opitutaceae bacterium]|jgi:hypothetical protein|nr:MbcA/ParS/Xre antitoxin family protein [Opitutaceae bacterium]
MATLEKLKFAYATPTGSRIPRDTADALDSKSTPGIRWHIEETPIKKLQRRRGPADFTWIDFKQSEATTLDRWWVDISTHLAELQTKATGPFHIFISGEASLHCRAELATGLYFKLPKPALVDIDFAGKPDVFASIVKFLALRHAERESNLSFPTAPALAAPANPALRVSNSDLRTSRGNLSIKLISGLFDIPVAEIGRVIGKDNRATLSKTPDADSLQEALRPFDDIASLRLAVSGGDKDFRKWLRTPNEHMQGLPPLHWIRERRVRDVAGFVLGALTGEAT